MIPLSQSLLLASFPKKKAGTALAIWGMTTLVAPVVGPVLGGWITDNISWPWIFYINIPVGVIAALATWVIYHKRETAVRKLPVDIVGLGLLIVWVGSLQIMLDRGKDLDWFASGLIVTLAIVAVIGFVFFLIWELTDRHPVVELRLFTRRNYWTSTLSMSLAYGAFFGNVVLLPLWLQQYMGYTATMAGWVLAPVGVLAILLTPFVGRTMDKVDPRIFATAAFLVFALVLWMRSLFNTQADLETLLLPTIIQGAAVAVFFIPLVNLSLSGLPPDQFPAASGLFNFARITAGAFGTSIVTTWWDTRAAVHHAQLVEHITAYDATSREAFATLQSSGLSSEQAAAALNRLVDQQAYMLSANDIFYVSAILFIVLIGVVWLARPVKGGHHAAEAATAH
jgi:DHA2 family multidrug resistance protein